MWKIDLAMRTGLWGQIPSLPDTDCAPDMPVFFKGRRKSHSPSLFHPILTHKQQGVATALSDARGCGGAKAEHLTACLRTSRMCPGHLCSGIRRIWSGAYHRDEFIPIFIFSSIFWCLYSVRFFMSVIFPALRKILVDQCVIWTVNQVCSPAHSGWIPGYCWAAFTRLCFTM